MHVFVLEKRDMRTWRHEDMETRYIELKMWVTFYDKIAIHNLFESMGM